MSGSILNHNIFYLPDGISDVNYQLIDNTNNEYINIVDFLQQYEKFKQECDKFVNNFKEQKIQDQILESPENNTEYNRLIPPYNAPCSNLDNGCIKKAAFKNSSNGKLFCWFHVNCQNHK
jgi:hypothetical protein